MKKNIVFIAMAALVLMGSCASKKELASCRDENKSLTSNLQQTKEDLAGKNARITSLEEQLAAQKRALAEQQKAYNKLQESLDKSLSNA